MFLPNDYFVCHHVDYIKGFLGPLWQDGDHGYSSAECCPSQALPLAGPGPFDKETIQRYQYRCGSLDLPVGQLSKGLIVASDVIG